MRGSNHHGHRSVIYEDLNDKKHIEIENNTTKNQAIKDLSKLIDRYMKQHLEAAKLKLYILWTTKNLQIRFTKQWNRNKKIMK